MGYMRHHAILITSYDGEKIKKAKTCANEIFSPFQIVSDLNCSVVNSFWSFAIFPDGSMEGWPESGSGDSCRERFVVWLNAQAFEDGSSPFDWAEIQYGDDNWDNRILRDDRHPVKEERDYD